MPDYLTLAYEGNYVGRVGQWDYFTYQGELFTALGGQLVLVVESSLLLQ